MADTKYADWITGALAPPWLLRIVGRGWLLATAQLLDDAVARGKLAVKTRWPATAIDGAALEAIGRDRMLPRLRKVPLASGNPVPPATAPPDESDAAFALRLQRAWARWGGAMYGNGAFDANPPPPIAAPFPAWAPGSAPGTPAGLLAALREYLPSTATVTLVTGATFAGRTNGTPVSWSTFWVIITGGPWATDGAWGDPGTWGDGGVWGCSAYLDQILTLKRIVETFRGAHEPCLGIYLVVGGTDYWGASAPWAVGAWGDTAAPIFLPVP